ncbi:very short patch repair endonuclease [Pseudomonas sp. AN3A02]|uniref:very short patch repair endonuclease n=1 Tax=Pseudomonas sp. AN3A02 TaxID=2719587 RepID=UPI001430F4F6|nr:very short patch repair endonuclease [Pseudomonas sp. AN3A02]NIL17286.1 DNA mismatch endonuclease Vsr [Pseudomonas sp. AN3A02]
MADIVDIETRSRMMAKIRSKNTSPELLIRKALHARGFRFRVHVKNLPGTPDLVLPKYNAAIFIHGCFWHGHDCRYFKAPRTRPEFWTEKIGKNNERDKRQLAAIQALNWRVLVIWECAVRHMNKDKTSLLIDETISWLLQGPKLLEIDEAYLKNLHAKLETL